MTLLSKLVLRLHIYVAPAHSAVLTQTQLDLNAEKSAGAATRRELAAAQTEARDNIYFKEK